MFKKVFYFIVLIMNITHAKSSGAGTGESLLHYVYREPKLKTTNPPVVILLHGVGSNENDLFSFADRLPDNFLVISARAPYTISEGSYAWYSLDMSTGKPVYDKEQAEKSRVLIFRFIEELKTKFHFDEKQIYLCGFSQGAIMSYSVGLTHPDKIKGIAIMSGRLLDEVRPLAKESAELKKLHVFISHGTKDPVLNIQYSRDAEAFLLSKGMKPERKEYPEVHTISPQMLNDLISWLKVSSSK